MNFFILSEVVMNNLNKVIEYYLTYIIFFLYYSKKKKIFYANLLVFWKRSQLLFILEVDFNFREFHNLIC